MSKIIKETDSRYKYLDDIFKKYSGDNVVYRLKNRTKPYYFIPPELVLTEIIRNSYGIYKLESEPVPPEDNLASSLYFSDILWNSCKLDPQDYYDLIYLHINDTELRPRCDSCGKYVPFNYQFTKAYGRSEEHDHYFCSKECQNNYRGPGGFIDWVSKSKANRTKFLNLGELDDICCLYISITEDDRFKFGASEDLDIRSVRMHYKNSKKLFIGTRLQVADLELLIKYHLKSYHEFLDWTPYMSEFRSAYLNSLNIILNKSYSIDDPDHIID
jgi:hypothetical protein